MNDKFRGFNYGELGEQHVLDFNYKEWSVDKKTILLEIKELKPNFRYQLNLTTNFRNIYGDRIKPFTIDFTTSKK